MVKKSLFDHFGPKYDPYQDIDKKKAIFYLKKPYDKHYKTPINKVLLSIFDKY